MTATSGVLLLSSHFIAPAQDVKLVGSPTCASASVCSAAIVIRASSSGIVGRLKKLRSVADNHLGSGADPNFCSETKENVREWLPAEAATLSKFHRRGDSD